MAFNPILETNIQPTQQVQKPSAGSAVVDLLGGLFPAREKVNPPSRTDLEAQAKQNTLRELSIAAQTGDTSRAASVYRNHTSQFGVGTSPEIDSAFTAITNQNPTIATYGGDNSIASLESNPAYGMGLELARSKNPNATPDELRSAALNYTSSKMANDAELEAIKQNKDITWARAQVTYDEGFNLLVKEARDMSLAINADQVITPEEAQQFRSYFAAQSAKFDAPPGVDADTWDKYQKEKFATFNNLVDTQLNNLLSDGPSKDMPKAMQALFDKLITQGKLPPGIMYPLNAGGSNQDAMATVLQVFNQFQKNPEWADEIGKVSTMSFDQLVSYATAFEEQTEQTWKDNIDTSSFTALTDAQKVDSLIGVDKVTITSADPTTAALGVTDSIEKVGALGYTSLDGALISRVFDGAFFSAVERISDKNPVLGAYFIKRTNEVLAQQQAALRVNINRVANANGFSAKTVNGKADFYPDPALMSDAAKAELDKFFDGDWEKAWAANGMAMVVQPGSMGRPANSTPNLANAFAQITKLQESLTTYDSVLKAADRLNGRLPEAQDTTDAAPTKPGEPVDSSTPEWQKENLTMVTAANGAKWQVNKEAAGAFQGFIAELESMGYKPVSSGGYNYRNIRGSNKLSEHATGNAIDINATANPMGGKSNDFPPNVSAIAAKYGLEWGGDWKTRPDPMHFEYIAGRTRGANQPPPSNGDIANLPPSVTVNNFGDLASAGADNPGAMARGGQLDMRESSGPAPSVSGTSFQPTTLASPDPTAQRINSNPEAKQAIPQNLDPAIVEFIEGLKSGRKEFNSAEELERAKASGDVKPGDIVFVEGRPILVK